MVDGTTDGGGGGGWNFFRVGFGRCVIRPALTLSRAWAALFALVALPGYLLGGILEDWLESE